MPLDLTGYPFPPAQNSRRTQITTTLPTYGKSATLLRGVTGPVLDYGAGKGLGALQQGWDSLEPYPPAGFLPTYQNSTEIEPGTYGGIVCLNVLNVLDPSTRAAVVQDILRLLQPNGQAIIMTRGRDVEVAAGAAGPEPLSRIIRQGHTEWYQKGFTPAELATFIRDTIGGHCTVERITLGPAAVLIRRNCPPA